MEAASTIPGPVLRTIAPKLVGGSRIYAGSSRYGSKLSRRTCLASIKVPASVMSHPSRIAVVNIALLLRNRDGTARTIGHRGRTAQVTSGKRTGFRQGGSGR